MVTPNKFWEKLLEKFSTNCRMGFNEHCQIVAKEDTRIIIENIFQLFWNWNGQGNFHNNCRKYSQKNSSEKFPKIISKTFENKKCRKE